MNRRMSIAVESFPLAEAFVISRGAKNTADVIVVQIASGLFEGKGECVPYSRYGETCKSVCTAIEAARADIEAGCSCEQLLDIMPAGAARNAVDCALWDLEAKRLDIQAFQLAGLHRLPPAVTAYTISAADPEIMAVSARSHAQKPVLKIKLAGDGDAERIAAVREAAPLSELIADANEGWRQNQLDDLLAACSRAGVALVEQPLPAGKDQCLEGFKSPVPLCADESVHTANELQALRSRYDAVNIKLDKAGGLTAALAMVREAQKLEFIVVAGSMVGTSLSMAPAMLLTPFARWVDLDGPLLLAKDREPGLRFEACVIYPPERALWG